MFKYLVAVLVLVFGAVIWMYFSVGVPVLYSEKNVTVRSVHRMGNLEQPLSRIYISAFYFIPKNKEENIHNEWQKLLHKKLDALVRFHTVQLQGASSILYEIYPEPIIGNLDNLAYDTSITQHGNPAALRRIVPEIESRVLAKDGDLYRADFDHVPPDAYHVLVIMYEGVGSTGGDNVALISRIFLSDIEYAAVSESLLAHEFYHTLGLPDAYTIPEGIATSADIMGLGRYRPIGQTFISQKMLQELGL